MLELSFSTFNKQVYVKTTVSQTHFFFVLTEIFFIRATSKLLKHSCGKDAGQWFVF